MAAMIAVAVAEVAMVAFSATGLAAERAESVILSAGDCHGVFLRAFTMMKPAG
jgi:hypothetical protein